MDIDFSQAWRSLHEMGNGFVQRLPYLIAATAVFLFFLFLAQILARLIHRLANKRKKHRNLGFVLSRLTQGSVVLMGLLVALVIAIPSFKPGQLIQVLGLSTVAIGFAFRDILQNFLAGIIILLTEPFRIGDQISLDAFYGIVEDIQTRATVIRTFDKRRIVIPNAEFFTKSVIVVTAFPKRRVEHIVGIGYGDNIEHAKNLILDSLKGIEGVLDDPAPDVKVTDLAASSVNLLVRWWITPSERTEEIDSRDKVLAAIKARLQENGIDLPYSTQTILFHDQTDENDGDRSKQREGWPAGKSQPPRSRSIAQSIFQAGKNLGRDGESDHSLKRDHPPSQHAFRNGEEN